MANYNKVILVGNLTRDPQMSYLPSQTPVVELGLAVNRRWKGAEGQQRDETCFVDCRAYGRQAETMNQYLRKGRPVLIEGRLQFSAWEDQDGKKRNKLRVVVENFQFLDSRGQGGQGGQAPASRPGGAEQPAPPADEPQAPHDDFEPAGGDDIPF